MIRPAAALLTFLLLLSTPAPRADAPDKEHDHDAAHQPTATHGFEEVDRWVEVFDAESRAEWQKPEEVAAELRLAPGMSIADIGAGTGYFERFFARAVGPEGKVLAVDTEPMMVAHITERAAEEKTPNVVGVLAAPDDPRLEPGSVDVVFICNTFHHIGDRIGYIGRLGTALKPAGVVAIVDFQKRELPVGPPLDHKLAREEVIAEFEEAGWRLARESDLLPYQYFLFFTPEPVRPRAEPR